MIKVLSILLFAVAAQAHVELGTYNGQTPQGQDCSMSAEGSYFENNMPHPLNERIQIKVNENIFVVGHPPVIDETQVLAAFDHDQFKGVLPNNKGAQALVVKMSHEEGKEGPTEFYLINHEYKTNQKELLACKGLKFSN